MSNPDIPDSPAKSGESIEFYTPGNYQPQDTVGYMIRNVHVSLNKLIDAEMQKYDLTAMQWRPLLLIYFGKVKTAAALAKETCLDTGATTRMLDRLQKKRLTGQKSLRSRSPCCEPGIDWRRRTNLPEVTSRFVQSNELSPEGIYAKWSRYPHQFFGPDVGKRPDILII